MLLLQRQPLTQQLELRVARRAHGCRVIGVGEHQVEVVGALRHLDRDQRARQVAQHAAATPRVVFAWPGSPLKAEAGAGARATGQGQGQRAESGSRLESKFRVEG